MYDNSFNVMTFLAQNYLLVVYSNSLLSKATLLFHLFSQRKKYEVLKPGKFKIDILVHKLRSNFRKNDKITEKG